VLVTLFRSQDKARALTDTRSGKTLTDTRSAIDMGQTGRWDSGENPRVRLPFGFTPSGPYYGTNSADMGQTGRWHSGENPRVRLPFGFTPSGPYDGTNSADMGQTGRQKKSPVKIQKCDSHLDSHQVAHIMARI